MLADLLTRRAPVRPSTFDAEKRTVEVIASTGAAVRRRDARGSYLEILDTGGAELKALIGAPVLDAHNQGGARSVLGVVETARLEGGEIILGLRFSDRAEIADIVRDIGNGILRSVSLGYLVETWADGTDAKTGERTRTATRWTPREVSFVPCRPIPAPASGAIL